MSDQQATASVVVHFRSFRPTNGPVAHVIDRLGALESEGRIDDVEVQTWPRRVTVSDHDEQIMSTFEAFRGWADGRDVTIRPPFEVTTYRCGFTGEEYEVLVTPSVCLAVYRDDELVGVYPHETDSGVKTVRDALSALEGNAELQVADANAEIVHANGV